MKSEQNPVRKSATRGKTRWIIRRSGFPFSLPGKQLGVVEAIDRAAAMSAAIEEHGREITVEPEHRVNPALEQAVAKAVKSAARRTRAGRYGRTARRRNPMTTNRHGDTP